MPCQELITQIRSRMVTKTPVNETHKKISLTNVHQFPAFVMHIFSRTSTTQSEVEGTATPDNSPSISDSDDSSQTESQGTPFSQLFNEAGEFEKVLLHSGCINPFGVCPKGTTGFADLVGCDLTKHERAVLDRDAQLYAAQTPWFLPESDDDSHTVDETQQPSREGFDLSHITQPDIRRASSVDNICLTHLEPQDIVDIMIKEFGPVAVPGEEEKLLIEADGCLIHDIAIIVSLLSYTDHLNLINIKGVIHLTTHRLAFHASLLATRPDLVSSNDALKAGAAVLHRKGWQSKRRIWLELTHDTLCAYVSSKDGDRMRPLCTLLCET